MNGEGAGENATVKELVRMIVNDTQEEQKKIREEISDLKTSVALVKQTLDTRKQNVPVIISIVSLISVILLGAVQIWSNQ